MKEGISEKALRRGGCHMDSIITVNNLVKTYGPLMAVSGISFEVERGSLFAFLGTNGAGKSTTINILSTLLKNNSGTVSINGWELGKNDREIRKDIGVVFQNGVLDDFLSVKENLMVRGCFYGMDANMLKSRIKEVARITECEDFLGRRYGKLSGGQKRRADIARALINRPKILFLDEPTTGLDPKTRLSIWRTIADMQKQSGMTVFLTTHYMEEAANADTVTIIHRGDIIAEGTPDSLKDRFTKNILRIYEPVVKIMEYFNKNNISYELNKAVLTIEIALAKDAIIILNDLKDMITSFEMIHGNLDDVFLKVTGEKREDE